MDVLVLLIAMGASGVMTAAIFKGAKPMWAMLGVFGVSIAFLTALVLASDANLTASCGDCLGGTYTIAAANGNFISDFNLLNWAPILEALCEVWIIALRVFRR